MVPQDAVRTAAYDDAGFLLRQVPDDVGLNSKVSFWVLNQSHAQRIAQPAEKGCAGLLHLADIGTRKSQTLGGFFHNIPVIKVDSQFPDIL